MGDVERDPGILDLLAGRRLSDRLDGGDSFADDAAHRSDTGPDRLAVELDRTGAARGNAAAELGAGKADHVAQHPEKRHVRGHVDLKRPAVDREFHGYPSQPGRIDPSPITRLHLSNAAIHESARTNAPRPLWRYKHYSTRTLCWPRWTH